MYTFFLVAKRRLLGYLKAWKASVEQRIELTKTEQNLMLLSAETQLGLEMTCMIFRLCHIKCLILWFHFLQVCHFWSWCPIYFQCRMFSPFSVSDYAKTHWNVFLAYKGREVVSMKTLMLLNLLKILKH